MNQVSLQPVYTIPRAIYNPYHFPALEITFSSFSYSLYHIRTYTAYMHNIVHILLERLDRLLSHERNSSQYITLLGIQLSFVRTGRLGAGSVIGSLLSP